MEFSITNLERLETARHKLQRKVLGTVWKDEVTNEAVCEKKGSNTMQSISKELRLRWLGNVQCMEISRILRQTMYWTPENRRGRKSRPRQSCSVLMLRRIREVDLAWENISEVTVNRA